MLEKERENKLQSLELRPFDLNRKQIKRSDVESAELVKCQYCERMIDMTKLVKENFIDILMSFMCRKHVFIDCY